LTGSLLVEERASQAGVDTHPLRTNGKHRATSWSHARFLRNAIANEAAAAPSSSSSSSRRRERID
jgi:hypothetical protein